jgi:Cu(I)/Ag(I) efflux system membrane fusion protein
MHPQIILPESGDCPICGMDLIPLVADDSNDVGPRAMSMSESSRALAEIATTEVKADFPEALIRLVGKLEYDETREQSLTARFPARIDTLYVNYTGVPVKRGEHLAEVYSPDLLSAQRELQTSYQRAPDSSITMAAREKLRLWGLLPEQIDALLASGKVQDHFELRAPIEGVVVAKEVKEGDYVKTGEPLFRIVDLSQLWLFLDAYESDLSWLRYGQSVEFSVEAYPGETFTGQIAFIEPELNRQTHTVRVRVNVANADGRLKPGMFVRGIVRSRIGANGHVFAPDFSDKWICPMHPEVVKVDEGSCDLCGMDLVTAEKLGYVDLSEQEAPLVVPASAVLQTGKRAVVYVAVPDTERPTYEGREVVLGPKAGDVFIVVSGLKAGERVVTRGAFKIDSALQIQAKSSMMSMQAGSGDTMVQSVEVAIELMAPYLELQVALAADDLPASKEALKAMMAITGHVGSMADLIHVMMAADSLDGIRRPHFEALSNAMIAAVKANPDAFSGELYLMHCPMVYEDRGADWLQSDRELMNPYYGSMMLHCGELKEAITPL